MVKEAPDAASTNDKPGNSNELESQEVAEFALLISLQVQKELNKYPELFALLQATPPTPKDLQKAVANLLHSLTDVNKAPEPVDHKQTLKDLIGNSQFREKSTHTRLLWLLIEKPNYKMSLEEIRKGIQTQAPGQLPSKLKNKLSSHGYTIESSKNNNGMRVYQLCSMQFVAYEKRKLIKELKSKINKNHGFPAEHQHTKLLQLILDQKKQTISINKIIYTYFPNRNKPNSQKQAADRLISKLRQALKKHGFILHPIHKGTVRLDVTQKCIITPLK